MPDGNRQSKKKKEEDLDRMYDKTLRRLKLNMGWIPRSCIPVCYSLKAESIKWNIIIIILVGKANLFNG